MTGMGRPGGNWAVCWLFGALSQVVGGCATSDPAKDALAGSTAGQAGGAAEDARSAGAAGDPHTPELDAETSAEANAEPTRTPDGERPEPSPADASVAPTRTPPDAIMPDAAFEASTAPESGAARGGVFVAVGYGGRVTRSLDDGRSWTDDTSLAVKGGDDDNLLRTVLWGEGQFIALGYRVLTSSDGHAWKAQGGVMGQWIGAAAYAKHTYVAVGGYGLRATSSDGVVWKSHALDTVASHEHGALVYGDVLGGRFVSSNDDGRRSYSSDGSDWKYSTGATSTTTALAFGQGIFVGIGEDEVVLSRDGGASWTMTAKLAVSVTGLVFADGHFTALADRHVFTSNDGSAWQDHPASNATGGPLAYGHGTYVSVRDTSFRRSSDGLTWSTPIETGGVNAYEWITFGTP